MRRQAMPLLGILLLVIIAGLWSASLRVSAQELQPLATNTPRILPTNTPRPPEATPMMPDAVLDFYALRLWDERGMVDLLTAQVRENMSANDLLVAIVIVALTWTIFWFARHSRQRQWLR